MLCILREGKEYSWQYLVIQYRPSLLQANLNGIKSKMSSLNGLSTYLGKPIFKKLFHLAEYSKLKPEEREMYNASLRNKWNAYDPKFGQHTVSGNRDFGFLVESNGSYTYYDSKVDRLRTAFNAIIAYVLLPKIY